MYLCTEDVKLPHEFESEQKAKNLCDAFILNRFIESGFVDQIEGRYYLVISEFEGKKFYLKDCRK